MKKFIILLIACIVTLCGCSANDSPIKPIKENEISIVGLWQHEEYPNAYSIEVHSYDDGIMNLTIQAVRGNYSQIATAKIDDIKLVDNKAKFDFTDSFRNTGVCTIEINENELIVSYEMTAPYQGGWCIDAGAGIYKKATEDLNSLYDEENVYTVEKEYENEMPLNIKQVFDPGKYVKVVGYRLDNDIYDKDIYYNFAWPKEDDIEFWNYGDEPNGEKRYGKYKIMSSDKNDYSFKIIFDFNDTEQDEIFYVKTIVGRMVFDYYYEDGTPYGRFENYDNYAVTRLNPDGHTCRFRYDHEYKEDQKYIHGSSEMDSPFKDIR